MDRYRAKSVYANLFRGLEAVGGKIHFNENSLIFKPHMFNIQKRETVIDYKDIASITKRDTLRIVPNGIMITLTNGTEYKFVVARKDRKELIKFSINN